MTEPLEIEGRALAVTLFEDRAEIVRTARITLGAGLHRVRLRGVTAFVDDRSVQAQAAGADVLTAHVVRRIVTSTELDFEALGRLEAEVRELEDRQSGLHDTRARAEQAHARDAALLHQWTQALGTVPSDAESSIEAWNATLDTLDAGLERLLLEATEARLDANELHNEAERARLRLAQGRRLKPRVEATIEVQLRLPDDAPPTELELRATYRTPCALWRPEHLARLTTAGHSEGIGRVELRTFAVIWQRTGESWDNVELRCSTARPSSASNPPLAEEDYLTLRRKSAEERRTVTVDLREATIAVADVEGGKRAVSDMPGVDDGGEPRVFFPRDRVSLQSDGEPFRVEVHRVDLAAEVRRVLMPERAAVAHIKATLTHQGDSPLLAGPVHIARDQTFVGRTRLRFVAPNEPFELGFGADDAVRVRRRVDEETDSTVMGTQLRNRKVTLYLSNLSDLPRPLRVTERVPVSEIEDVSIHLTDTEGWTVEAKDGFLHRELTLPPNDTTRLELAYRIKAASNVNLPF